MKASFNELSIDVLRHLLEATALDDRKIALTLVLLSKTVREWIDPIIYRRAVLTMENILKFERTVRVRNDVAFFARNVRVLSLAITRSPEYAQAAAHILSICTGVKSLAWHSFSASFPPMNSISPTHMSVVEPSSQDMALLPPSVTHLALSAETFKDAETLTVMGTRAPNLTHIMLYDLDVDFDGLFPAHFIHYVLSELASDVKYLIVVFPPTPRGLTWPFARFISQLKDARFVPVCLEARYHRDAIPGLACYAHDHNVFDDWGYRLGKDEDVWTFAEEFAREREASGFLDTLSDDGPIGEPGIPAADFFDGFAAMMNMGRDRPRETPLGLQRFWRI
ncbi:hypothetical protein BDZ89DRAFT_1165034 [Hymenopellis radicata]|nr:hypothetical protein BDZ89DRAFT_1165034 [Hymenopellis radicata]